VPTACKTLFVYYDKITLYELVYCVSCRSGSLRDSSVCSKYPTLPKLSGVSHVYCVCVSIYDKCWVDTLCPINFPRAFHVLVCCVSKYAILLELSCVLRVRARACVCACMCVCACVCVYV
jgi:hypothetical protein